MKEEKDENGDIIMVPGSTKYFDVGRLLVDKQQIDEYRREIGNQDLILYLNLDKNFEPGKPISNFYDGLLKSLKTTQQNNFDQLETLKYLLIEIMNK